MSSRCVACLCCSWTMALALGWSGQAAYAKQPRVVRTVPADGATGVDPALNELLVEFDQDMNRGSFSWTGGGETFPKLRGRPRWVSKRICLLPVELQPDHSYVLGINSSRHHGFVNLAGEPAVAQPLRFSTAKRALDPKTAVLTPELNRRSSDELRRSIEEDYSHRDLRGVDWDKLFARRASRLEAAKTPAEFATEAGRLLAKAKDVHIWLTVGDQTFGTYQRRIKPNYDAGKLPERVPHWQRRSACVATGRFEGDIGYILIESWEHKYAQALEAASDALDEFSDTTGLIVDLRPNSGGDENLARQFAGCFVEQPCVYARHVNRAVDERGGFTRPFDRVLTPTAGRATYQGKVVVLMGPVNMSSAEGFLLMMRQVPGCKLVGATSYGASGNPQATALPNGVTVYLPSWKAMTADGDGIEGVGLEPDVEVKTTRSSFRRADPVLAKALELLGD